MQDEPLNSSLLGGQSAKREDEWVERFAGLVASLLNSRLGLEEKRDDRLDVGRAEAEGRERNVEGLSVDVDTGGVSGWRSVGGVALPRRLLGGLQDGVRERKHLVLDGLLDQSVSNGEDERVSWTVTGQRSTWEDVLSQRRDHLDFRQALHLTARQHRSPAASQRISSFGSRFSRVVRFLLLLAVRDGLAGVKGVVRPLPSSMLLSHRLLLRELGPVGSEVRRELHRQGLAAVEPEESVDGSHVSGLESGSALEGRMRGERTFLDWTVLALFRVSSKDDRRSEEGTVLLDVGDGPFPVEALAAFVLNDQVVGGKRQSAQELVGGREALYRTDSRGLSMESARKWS